MTLLCSLSQFVTRAHTIFSMYMCKKTGSVAEQGLSKRRKMADCRFQLYFDPRWLSRFVSGTLKWRHNERDGVSNHQFHDCLLKLLVRRRSKKTPKLRVIGLCERWPVNSPHKWPVTRKMFPFDDIMIPSAREWVPETPGFEFWL